MDVAVIHQENLIAGGRQHLHQIADFDICSEDAVAHDELNRERRIFCLKFTHQLDGGICGVTDTEDQLKLRIVLFAVAAEALKDSGIDAPQGLEYRNWWQLAL